MGTFHCCLCWMLRSCSCRGWLFFPTFLWSLVIFLLLLFLLMFLLFPQSLLLLFGQLFPFTLFSPIRLYKRGETKWYHDHFCKYPVSRDDCKKSLSRKQTNLWTFNIIFLLMSICNMSIWYMVSQQKPPNNRCCWLYLLALNCVGFLCVYTS